MKISTDIFVIDKSICDIQIFLENFLWNCIIFLIFIIYKFIIFVCPVTKNIFGWRNNTLGKELALKALDLDLISSTPFAYLSTIQSDHWTQRHERNLSVASLGLRHLLCIQTNPFQFLAISGIARSDLQGQIKK